MASSAKLAWEFQASLKKLEKAQASSYLGALANFKLA
jgi:hypothetical protein